MMMMTSMMMMTMAQPSVIAPMSDGLAVGYGCWHGDCNIEWLWLGYGCWHGDSETNAEENDDDRDVDDENDEDDHDNGH